MTQTEAIKKVLAEVERQYLLVFAGAPNAVVDHVMLADAIMVNVTTPSGRKFSIFTKTLVVGQL